MSDKIIITDDSDKPTPTPEVIVVASRVKPKVEKIITEKTTVVETRRS